MKESPTTLRTYLALTGALALLSAAGIVVQLRHEGDKVGSGTVIFSLVLAALSALNGVTLLFSSWQTTRLIGTAPKFLRFAMLFRYALLLVERAPFAISGDYLSISMLLLWTGVTFYMVKTVDRLAAGAKPDAQEA
jgi:hypothetical protein